MATKFQLDPKYIPDSGVLLTNNEADNLAQLFGLRLIDWRRMDDQAAGDFVAAIMNKYGSDAIMAALLRVRRLAGRDRAFWLMTIQICAPPEFPNLIKTPPNIDEDELWRLAFLVFFYDEARKFLAAREKALREAAISEAMA